MKKVKFLALTFAILLTLTLCACTPTVIDDELTVNVAVLNGTTGFGMAKLISDSQNGETALDYNFSIETDATMITDKLIQGTVDIAALPTNAASVLYNKTEGGVKVLALNTLGVLYVVENGNTVSTMADLEGKTVYCPAQNPEFVLRYLCNVYGLENVNIDTTYASPKELMQFIVPSNEGTIAVLPEPVLSVATSKNANLNVALDLTAEWDNKSENSSLVQGCIVVRTEFLEAHEKEVLEFLEEYERSVNYVNTNTDEVSELVVSLGIYEGASAVAKKAIPKCNVKYIDGVEMKNALSGFLSAMADVNAKSIGGKLPDDNFYFIAK